MKFLGLYEWIAGSAADFKKPFQNNQNLFDNAEKFWNNLESISWIFVLLFVLIAGFLAWYYYVPYNNKPGRHYKPKYWLIFFCVTFAITLGLTYVTEVSLANPSLNGASMLELKIALGNAVFASAFYFIVSFVWCAALPTNACRLFKF